MLTRLRLVNWTSHKDSEIIFGKGANIFVGVMGSGKSSALEALSFALFGSIPEGSRRKAKLSDLIRFGEESASVEIELEIDKQTYKIIRKINRKGGSEAFVYRGVSLVAQSPAMANKYLESLLGTGYDLFSAIVYSPQNRIDSFINLPPKDRKEAIDGIIGLSGVLSVEDNAVKVLNRLRLLHKEMAVILPSEADIAAKKKELADISSSLSSLKAELENADKEASSVISRLANAAKSYQSVSAKRRERDRIAASLSSMKGSLDTLSRSFNPAFDEKAEKKAFESVNLLKAETAQLESIERSLSRKANIIRDRVATAKAAEERAARAKNDILRLDTMLEQLGGKEAAFSRAAEIDALLAQSGQKSGALKSELKEASHGLDEIGSAGAKCPVCMSELSDDARARIEKEWEGKKAIAESGIRKEEGISASLSRELEGLKDKMKRIEVCLARREAAFSQVNEGRQVDARKDAGMLADAEKAMEETRQAAKDGLAKLVSAESSFNEIRRNVAVAKEINLAKASISSFENSLSALGFSEDDYAKAEERYRVESANAEKARAVLGSANARVEISSKLKADREGMLARYASERQRHARIESLVSDLSVFREALNGIQLMLRNSIIEDINLGINDIWSYAYPYSDYERVRLIGGEGSYSFEVFANGEWKDISVVASGGEKTIAAIALRIALAAVLAPQMGCIVLDEPTHNLDGNGIDRLSSLIKDRLPALVDQFVIVTHDDRLMSSGMGTVFRFLREKSGNDPTSVEKVGYA